jgi:hypothetical protein
MFALPVNGAMAPMLWEHLLIDLQPNPGLGEKVLADLLSPTSNIVSMPGDSQSGGILLAHSRLAARN